MPTAYVLLNTEIGAENHVLKAIKRLNGVEEAYSLWGVYDIIVNVTAKSMEELKHIITHQINEIGQINSKLTMIIYDKAPVVIPSPKSTGEQGIINGETIPIFA
jgi:DNA-binding Lrp family transcriptional regulator